ncbi:hypothetical protein PSYJA_08343 [Pseudomonas syringae pv. japonica str. M301072]|uniref:Uncharacterized protein n=1 Tax=Pseudomonas syringae pv. japonica str. M301072 TaxID=629262 RepID=F3FFJ0_PSESX|nr:hypothetical protein PSYJA_08343 [Pseudomonas syringae pv. japonica str. M301072]
MENATAAKTENTNDAPIAIFTPKAVFISISKDIEDAVIIPCTDRKKESCWSDGLFLQNYQTISS